MKVIKEEDFIKLAGRLGIPLRGVAPKEAGIKNDQIGYFDFLSATDARTYLKELTPTDIKILFFNLTEASNFLIKGAPKKTGNEKTEKETEKEMSPFSEA